MLSFLKLVTKKIFYKTKLLSKKYSHFKNDIEVHSKWYGNHYGGFFVAPQYLSKRSKIYSFGIGEDLSFELSLSKEFGCSFKCFDPTPKSIDWINRIKPTLTGNLEIFDYGLANHTSVSSFFLPKNDEHVSGSIVSQQNVDQSKKIKVTLKSLQDICNYFGEETIDVLKMDIEGAEYDVIRGFNEHKIRPHQLLVELHGRLFPDQPIIDKNALSCLRENGYRLFNISYSFQEASFIHETAINRIT